MSNIRPVTGFPHYFISSDGDLYSDWDGRGLVKLRAFKNRKGYVRYSLHRDKHQYSRYGHVLVLEAFIGTRPEGCQTAHLNGVRHDNRAENLQWATPKQNASHKKLHGTELIGSRNHQSKLTEADIEYIRANYRASRRKGSNVKELAARFGVNQWTIRTVANNVYWTHVDPRKLKQGIPAPILFTEAQLLSAFAKALGVPCARGWSTGQLILQQLTSFKPSDADKGEK